MAEAVSMPRQGQSVESCIITMWYKQVGDKVLEGDLLFSYETDKAAFDEEAKSSGILLEHFYSEGDEVPVLATIGVIGEKGEDISSFSTDKETVAETQEKETEPEITIKDTPRAVFTDSENLSKIRISPRARKIAERNNIEITELTGSGPNGRIIADDVEKALKSTSSSIDAKKTIAGTSSQKDVSIAKISNIRKIIAGRMSESLRNSAQLTHHLSADARKMLKLRKDVKLKVKTEKLENITINDIVCFALIKTLKQHSAINVHFLGDTIKTFHKVHLGIAVNTERGLMVPVLKNADDYNLPGLSTQLKKIAEDCRSNKINPELLQAEEGSFTVSNLGSYGIEMFTPVLNLPQAGILGINTITHQAKEIEDNVIGFVPSIGLSLTYDHRAIDGAPASHFLSDLKDNIEKLDIEL